MAARAERTGGLANTARPQFGGFPPLGSRNSDEKSTQSASRSQRFGDNAAWQASSGIWGSSVVANNYNRSRDASRSRDLDARPSGSGALTATSEAEPWGARSGPWKQVDTTSPTLSTAQSGSNSPIRHRGSIQGVSAQALGDLANASSYYTSRAVGQPAASSFGRAKNDLDQNGHKLGSNMANHLSEDKENPVQRGRLMSSAMESDSTGMRMDRSQFPGHLSVGGTPRDASVASARHSDIGLPNNSLFQQNAYPFGHTPHNSISQQRQSFSGRAPSFSQPSTQSPIEPAQHREVDLSAELSRFHFGKNEAQVYNHQPASEHSYPSPGNHHAQPGIKLNAQSPMYVGQGAAATRALGFAADGSPDFAQRYHAQSGPVSGRTSVSPPSTDPRGAGSSGAYGAASIDSEGFQRTDVHEQAPHALNQAYLERQLLAHQHNQHNQQLPPFVAPQYIYNNVVANFDVTSQHYRFPQAGVPYGYQLQMPGAFNVMPMAPKGPREEPKRAVGSALLEEYKTNTKSSRKFELKDVFGHITEFSGDTQGSRFIQQKLETANSDEKEMVFREIEKNALQLMTDVFGNYVVQKLFEHGSQVQKRMLADTMRNHVFNLSLQPYGCRVVQKALEHVLVDQQADLVKELRVDIMRCVKDQHGNHVVQKAIERVPSEHTRFIMDAFRGQVHSLATHNYGCRVVQRMLEFSPPADQAEILAELHQCAPMLIQDQFGNYVIQHIIVHGKPEDRSAIIKIVQSQIVTLSKHKFASNVVEKSIQYGTEEERKNIVTQLTTDQPNGTSPLSLLMKDQFGNYVIQKLLGQLDGEDRERVVEVIKPLLAEYKKYNYGKQIAAIEKLVFKGASSTNSRTSAPIDINSRSEAPTPILTMEQNSPQSCSPPSTNASINEANVGDVTKALPEVRIAGAED